MSPMPSTICINCGLTYQSHVERTDGACGSFDSGASPAPSVDEVVRDLCVDERDAPFRNRLVNTEELRLLLAAIAEHAPEALAAGMRDLNK